MRVRVRVRECESECESECERSRVYQKGNRESENGGTGTREGDQATGAARE